MHFQALPLLLKVSCEKARWENRCPVLCYLYYGRSEATITHEPHLGSCTARRESWTIHHQRQPMPPSLPIGTRPTSQPRRSTPCSSTLKEGRRTHPQCHDTTAPEENMWTTTSVSVISPSLRNQWCGLPQCGKYEATKEKLAILFLFFTTIHPSLSSRKFHNDQVPRYGRASPAIPWYSGTTGITVHWSMLDYGPDVVGSHVCFFSFSLKKVWGSTAITRATWATSVRKKENSERSNHS
jgi:hypothetical protein